MWALILSGRLSLSLSFMKNNRSSNAAAKKRAAQCRASILSLTFRWLSIIFAGVSLEAEKMETVSDLYQVAFI
jgi:hypothetical protein